MVILHNYSTDDLNTLYFLLYVQVLSLLHPPPNAKEVRTKHRALYTCPPLLRTERSQCYCADIVWAGCLPETPPKSISRTVQEIDVT